MKQFEQLCDKLVKKDLSTEYFFCMLKKYEYLNDFEITSVEELNSLGLDAAENNKGILSLLTKNRAWQEQRFCVVDIETNNLTQNDARVIEIGAVILKGGKILDEFNSFAFTDFLPETIVNLTGITVDMLKNAPSEAEVLEKFRLFLGTDVFVAHNVDFDYTFLSDASKRHHFAPFLNRKLCTIKFARKTIKSVKYGLGTLCEVLDINEGTLHRALSDAKSAARVFQESCKNLPKWVVTTEDLIEFTKSNKNFLELQLPFIDDEQR
ncbi:MAG: 3'-5' exonuclease [Campylobacteraceae bacterium]|nr:3'-5' exonuclease [Campylobacteraceae bacterium]